MISIDVHAKSAAYISVDELNESHIVNGAVINKARAKYLFLGVRVEKILRAKSKLPNVQMHGNKKRAIQLLLSAKARIHIVDSPGPAAKFRPER